jgi:XTP/dITP diphosphohydrolase
MFSNTQKLEMVFATNNKHKFDEINDMIGQQVKLKTLREIGFTDEIPEDFNTLEQNAAQKAFYIYDRFGVSCFADDSGLEIDALNGEPGVYSARYAGSDGNFENNIRKVLDKMGGIQNRYARFRTVIALVENGKLTTFEGVINGWITETKKGFNGFGYDPVFQPEGFEKTFAEMSHAEKNVISHRALAIHKFVNYLRNRN